MQNLSGRTAVVTGAASGLGRAIALACANAGMRLVLADLDLEGARETAAMLQPANCQTLAVYCDVSNPQSVDALADAAFAAFGEVGLLINNAGVMVAGPAWEMSLADWNWSLGINLMGVVHGLRSFVPRMLAGGMEGHIVNTASLAGLLGGPGMAGYTAGKHAIVGLSECLAQDLRLARAKIGVSVLCPGFVPTRLAEVSRYGRNAKVQPPARRVERQLKEAAITADDVAAAVIEAVRKPQFYVLTHAGSDAAIAKKFEAIASRALPPIARI